jgi:hypothetical protein
MRRMSIFLSLMLTFLAACSNFQSGVESLSVPTDSALDGSLSTTNYTHQMVQVSVTAGTTSAGGLSLSLAVAAGADSLQNYCATGGSLPCACELKWVQSTTAGTTTTSVARTKRLSATAIQNAIVDCAMESSFWDEIAVGTVITTKIVPLSGNDTALSVRAIGYKKGSSISATGDFLDSSLTPFRNIVRYACYSKRKVWDKLRNDTFTSVNEAGTDSTNTPFSTSFCLDGVSGIGGQCPGGSTIYSAQSYYRSLYIQSDRVGQINTKNSAFECPMVEESIKYSSPASAIPTADRGKAYPLDSQFSLAQLRSGDWSVPVSSSSVLYKAGSGGSDPDSSDAPCSDDPSAQADSAIASSVPIARKCLGYAKKPLSNGSCGSFTDSNGVIRPLTRLRRFRTLYPQFFKPNGSVESGNAFAKRWMDEVLVADRLEVNAQGQLTGNAIFGPKPCPFSWFDHSGTTTGAASDSATDLFLTDYPIRSAGGTARYGVPSYKATSNYSRDNFRVNPDGYHFPNYDIFNEATTALAPGRPHSCSATMSVVERVDGAPVSVRLLTTNYTRSDVWDFNGSASSIPLSDIQIRPIEPFMPQYFEDTTFQACVPASSEYLDPPLYLFRNTATDYAWCSKPYPTANPYWRSLNAKKRVLGTQANTLSTDALAGWGGVAPVSYFTSTTNDAGGNPLNALNVCAATTGICSLLTQPADQVTCATYIGDATAGARCDRTVRLDATTDFRTFPLQATDPEIAIALNADMDLGKRTYGCTYSIHPNRTYLGTRSPGTGCCGMKNGAPIVSSLAADGVGGHLEPVNPGSLNFPNRRYCGDPIQ